MTRRPPCRRHPFLFIADQPINFIADQPINKGAL
jgi:hypothetical protein